MKDQLKVAQYLERQIAICDKSQKEIANHLGYEKPNVISMIKSGQTKLPLDKVGAMAEALNIDPRYLLRLTMSEYAPGTWAAIAPLLGEGFDISANERTLIMKVREESGGNDIDMQNPSVQKMVGEFAKSVSFVQANQEVGAVDRLNKSSPNQRQRTNLHGD